MGRGRSRLLDGLCRVLKVPPEPSAPAGAPGSVRTFRAARGFYSYRLLAWGLSQAGAAAGLFVGVSFLRFVPAVSVLGIPLSTILGWFETLAVIGFVAQLPLGPFLVRLDYEMRWYVMTDRSLRIREGILRVREQTLTFHNIQNLSIRQGPLQRLFGIEDLRVRTAGGGGSPGGDTEEASVREDMHEGFFRGVENASAIRDAILAHLKGAAGDGLGGPEGARPAPSDPTGDLDALVRAARLLRDEAAALRRAVAGEERKG
ncbi:MAG: PH domain-containing protein [Acidobacteriota bacterium]